MTEFSKILMVSTDVAHIVLFHPDDLAHASEWPIAWYSEPFVFPAESAAGQLIAWCTKSDGGFAVRVTNGAMTEREQRYAGPSWVFPYTVRHGRVFLDNTDALPGAEQMTRTSDYEDYWVDLANGTYAVTVTAIEWSAEPGAREGGLDTLPNYVVQFQPRSSHPIKPARRPPDLECLTGAGATDEIYIHTPKPPKPIDFDRHYPTFASLNVTRTGQDFSTQGEAPIEAAMPRDGDKFAIFDKPFVVAAELVPGALAVIAQCHGSGGHPGEATRYSFRARQIVEISDITGAFVDGQYAKLDTTGFFRRQPRPIPPNALAAVRIRPLPPATDTAPSVVADALRSKVLDDLRGGGLLASKLGGLAIYEALRLEASQDAGILANWLIDNLPMPAGERLRISVLPPNAQFAALSALYAGTGTLDERHPLPGRGPGGL
ncbi:hypothetical protein HFO63_27500 [Rhizobium laguerreae]|uniref:Phage tail protein n=1 Tax=Rhizobium laguerreae TaxID=1076926 RepID=A0AB35FGD7_9HYPH|nr:hypothetical protein [Rhizobium laguerreae]MBY3064788.1 hypothetical protein [Rhizobium laguerreae]MBY3088936.1 hypothetical protein [Rhizobium laguerreae]MBY3149285.1 hypothetical protein [Rhizobium laguerreae]